MGLRLGSLAYDTEDTTTSTATSCTFPHDSSSGKSQFSEEASRVSMDNSYPDGKILEAPNLKEFSFTDLKTATKNFKSDSVLGEGIFGKVFKGWVDEKTLAPSKAGIGMVVAIKKLNSESMQGFQEWQNYNAKISDFRLAKLGPSGGNSHVTTRVMGTYGYAAPEYIATAHGRQAEAEANTTATTTPVGSSKIIESSGTSSSNGKSLFSEGASMLSMDEYPDGKILEAPNLKEFTFTDLKTATKNFKSDSVLGEGGFGRVFKGWVDEKTLAPSKAGIGMVVAIKKLNSESMQGFQEWQSEVNFLGRLSHPNLVRLLGYCWEDKELLLVYEFMSKGSLENHLFRRNPNIEPLSWDIRLKILIGAARGLAFLHTSEKKVIYRDFKASNILLDGNYNAKISDFGLAKLGPSGGDSHVTTRVMGTYGYAAPEYIATGHLYVKSDVYGFGVVLLEMLTGLRALDTKRPSGQQNLVEWLKPSLSSKRKLKSIMDIRMEGQCSTKAALQAGQLTLKCLKSDPKSRPAMKEVVEELEGLEAMKEKPKDCKTKSTHSTPHHHSQHPIHHRYTGHHAAKI